MRVLLSRRLRQRDERGAIVVMMAASMVLLCVLGAFVVDFGQAYVTKNETQQAADAGALAAGKVYMTAKATCANIDQYKDAALAQAEAVRQQAMPGSHPTAALSVVCDNDAIKVGYDVTADSALGLGALVTGSDHMTVGRHAAVKFGISESAVGNLRPWMICGAQVPAGPPFEQKVVEIGLPGNGHKPPQSGCETNKPGDWWISQCYGSTNDHDNSYQAVLSGCPETSLAPLSTPAPATPAALGDALLRDCNLNTSTPPKQNGPWAKKDYCLPDDQGHDVKGLAPAWQTLLGQTIAMPVFCDVPQCDPSSIQVDNHGKSLPQGEWPVWKIAAVTVCGYALHGVYSPSTLPTGDCNNYNTDHLTPLSWGSADSGFLVIFKGLLQNGGDTTFPVQANATLRLVE